MLPCFIPTVLTATSPFLNTFNIMSTSEAKAVMQKPYTVADYLLDRLAGCVFTIFLPGRLTPA
ncbi:hypothetical protein KCP73_20765 [Salmonella enterica subsp. enterica]|nr:hypothetical protein KCP73_20765 [Salmonella enterica subsp. enterica]